MIGAELFVFSGGRFLDVLFPSDGVVIRSGEPLPELAIDAYDWRVFSVVDGVGYVGVTESRIEEFATPVDGASWGDVETGHLYAIDLASLATIWNAAAEDAVGAVIDVGGPTVAIGSTFQRIDAATGTLTELADVGDGVPATMSGVPVQRTTGTRAWFVMHQAGGLMVVELDAGGVTGMWSLGIEGAPVYADIVADPDGSLRILGMYGSSYVIPVASATPDSGYRFDEDASGAATPSSQDDACEPGETGTTPIGWQGSFSLCTLPVPAVDPTTPVPDEGMYATNATPEGRDSTGAGEEVPGSTRPQPTPGATIMQPGEPSANASPTTDD